MGMTECAAESFTASSGRHFLGAYTLDRQHGSGFSADLVSEWVRECYMGWPVSEGRSRRGTRRWDA